MAQNSQAVIPDNIIVVDGEINPVPTPAAGDSGKVLTVIDAEGTIGWSPVSSSGTQLQADWTEEDTTSVQYIAHKPTLATVATSGSYSDLSGTPTIPSGDELVPSATSADEGKVLTVDSEGGTEWVTPSDTTYSAGDGIAIDNNNAISADVDGTTIGIDSTTKKIKLLSTIPTVDQSYSAVSTNAQSGAAVAEAISGISVDEVPAVESTDDGKVLSASYSGGQGSYSWVTPTDTTYSAGTGIDISAQNAISIDTTTVATKNDLPSSSDLVPSSSSGDAGKVLTVDALGTPSWVTPSGGTTYSAGDGIAIDGNNVVSADVDGTTIGIDSTSKKIKLLSTIPTVDQTYNASSTNAQSGTAVASAVSNAVSGLDEVPTVTSSDDGKVLKATYSGGQGSYAWGADNNTTYTAGNMIAINANNSNAIGVSTTAGITDIQQVAALPANPVSTVLYLIPET